MKNQQKQLRFLTIDLDIETLIMSSVARTKQQKLDYANKNKISKKSRKGVGMYNLLGVVILSFHCVQTGPFSRFQYSFSLIGFPQFGYIIC